MESGLPTGTVTFLFTDIEGSTRIAQEHRGAWETLRARHHAILRAAIEAHNGYVFQIIGDAFCAAFHGPGDAVRAAVEAQYALQTEAWGEAAIRVRMGICTGEAEAVGQEYRGYLTLSSVQRVMSAAHGGQVLLAQAAYDLIENDLPDRVALRDLGEHRLKGFQRKQHLYQLVIAGLPSDFPPLRVLEAHPHNLPAQLTSFIGREKESVEIEALINDPGCRLLTLIGPGGSGKTRLAIRVAASVLQSFPDGIYFVPLESIISTNYLIPAIAHALRFNIDSVADERDAKMQLLEYLRKRSMLLVLDGCECLIGIEELLPEILGHAPQVRVLATSRQKLNVQYEWTYPVEGLHLPQSLDDAHADDAEAAKLFSERARRTTRDSLLFTGDHEAVAHICRLVDGMPLAIELAAAWTAVLSPAEILREVEKSLDFLVTTMRDIPEKHRSLRAAFDSSWLLLSDEQRDTFSRLSVFRGEFDRQAALEVTGAGLQQLSALLDRSLLWRTDAGRFAMHSLLRQYAAEKLSQSPALEKDIQDRFCRYYVDQVTRREVDLMGAGMLQARDEIRLEMNNVRAAVNWAAVHWEANPARKMLISMLCLYAIQGWHEGALAFKDIAQIRRDDLVAREAPDPVKDPLLLSACIHQAFVLSNLGQIDESDVISRNCLDALRGLQLNGELSECLHNLGVNASFRGEYESAIEYLKEAVRLGQECDHSLWPSYLLWLGHVHLLRGEYVEGMLSLRECYDLFDRKGTLWGTAFALSKMALAADGLGEHAQAMKYHQEALSVFERLGSQAGKGYSLGRMSISAYFLEQYSDAVQFGEQGREICEDIDHRWGILSSLCAAGFAYIGLGNWAEAESYFREALQESRQNGMAPMSLYALAGLACCLALKGEEKTALNLIRFVRRHPETPPLYLAQAGRWIRDQEKSLPESTTETSSLTIETIDQAVDLLPLEISVRGAPTKPASA